MLISLDKGFPGGSAVKNLSAMWEMEVWSMSQEDPLEKEMVTHYSILSWETPWTEEPDGLRDRKRVGHNLATKQQQPSFHSSQIQGLLSDGLQPRNTVQEREVSLRV